jgi:S1-C subfamily serine protease
VDAAGIAARVDPAVVDITASLAGQRGVAAGTGMVISPSGAVLTNNHVVEGSASITVRIAGVGRSYPARVVGVDPTDDVAVIQIDNVSKLPTVTIGDSSKVVVGDPVVALGNALGREGTPTLTQGFVTGLDQSITAGDSTGNSEDLGGLIQINALIQPGDSGGPLLNSAGQVIGMNTAAGGSRRLSGGTAFAIPSNTARSIAQQIQSGKASDKILLGQGALLGVEIATTAGRVSGAPVVGVTAGGPAQSAGIAAGDVIVSLAGKAVDTPAGLSPAIRAHRPGDRVDVGWLDPSGQPHHATVQLIPGPPA